MLLLVGGLGLMLVLRILVLLWFLLILASHGSYFLDQSLSLAFLFLNQLFYIKHFIF